MTPVELIAIFLRKPISNAVRFRLAKTALKFPFLSKKRRAALSHSAAKRDARWMATQIESLSKGVNLNHAQTGFTQAEENNFSGYRGKDRHLVAGSKWHRSLLAQLASQEVDFATLPTISISFVTYNSANWLPDCLKSLTEQLYPISKINLYFIDHGSKDQTLTLLQEFIGCQGKNFASVKLHQQANKGFGLGHDFTFQHSEDEYVLISNVDLEFHDRSILGVVLAATIDSEDVASWELRQCPYEHPKYYDPVTLKTLWSSYACILLRRSAYLEVGGFEERIFMYGEDVELSYRFRGAGYELRYLPQVSVTHYVDFKDSSLRPNQLSGSYSANVLLRHRYAEEEAVQYGKALLNNLVQNEGNKTRLMAFEKAQEKVKEDQHHFSKNRKPKLDVEFPFRGFEYDVIRVGHDVPLNSRVSIDGPLVSIVTRTHGSNIDLLREAIACVANQTYKRIEHIIVEDQTQFASSLVEGLKSVYQHEIRYLSSSGGRSLAGNKGLEESKGDLLLFLDNDDLLFCDHLEILVRCLDANPSSPAAYALSWEIPTSYDQNGRYVESPPIDVFSHLGAFKASRLKRGNFIPIQNIMFRRALHEEYGGFDPEIDHLEDWNLWCRYSQAGDFVHVPKITSMYRTPSNSIQRDSRVKVMLEAEPNVRKINETYFQ